MYKSILKFEFKKGFSLVEILIALIVISIVVAAFVPLITKKLNSQTLSFVASSEISSDCQDNDYYSSDCGLCTESYCISCPIECDEVGKFKNSKKCICQKCSENPLYGSACLTCDDRQCTKCAMGYYIHRNGFCQKCPDGTFCDGINMYSVCPSGYYCDSNNMFKCTEKFNSNCIACNLNSCTKCDRYYGLSNDGKCVLCDAGLEWKCFSCSKYGINICDEGQCVDNYLRDSNGQCTILCSKKIDYCLNCSDESTCTACKYGYFINTEKKCTKCNVDNCAYCRANKSADSPECQYCIGGYFLNSDKKCASCKTFDENCASCDETACQSCTKDYVLNKDGICVKADNTKFSCSGSDFMKIGNLCFTRKNMGDSANLKIPSSVTTVQVNADTCYSSSAKCCWKGATASSCDSKNGDYSGCNRTVCNYSAAEDICKNFNYDNRTWRVPTKDEAWNIAMLHTIGMKNDGLMFCDDSSSMPYNSYCYDGTGCLGGYYDGCYPKFVWTSTLYPTNALRQYIVLFSSGIWQLWSNLHTVAGSVRCVTDFDE